jgi:hypothetical protein
MTTAPNTKITAVFLHPRDSREFKAEVGPGTTGKQAIDGLVKAGFIEAAGATRAYALQLQRTGATIPVSAALVTAGIQDGDIVAVTETSAGA